MAGFEVVMDRDRVEVSFLRDAASLPEIIRNLGTSTPFVCLRDGVLVAECLARAEGDAMKVVNYACTDGEDCRDMLLYVMEHSRGLGLRFVDIGCGNANVELYGVLQRIGFRVVGVVPDHFLEDSKVPTVENSIVNRDLIHFRVDLNEKQLATTGYDASGRT